MLLRRHRGPLAADFRRYYQLSPLAAISDWGIPLSELAEYVAHLPPDSATMRTVDKDAWVTPEVQMLREMEHTLRVLKWQRTDDGAKARNYPKPIPLTAAEKAKERDEAAKNGDIDFDVTTKDRMRQLLGW